VNVVALVLLRHREQLAKGEEDEPNVAADAPSGGSFLVGERSPRRIRLSGPNQPGANRPFLKLSHLAE
jgi:hypothetical protein